MSDTSSSTISSESIPIPPPKKPLKKTTTTYRMSSMFRPKSKGESNNTSKAAPKTTSDFPSKTPLNPKPTTRKASTPSSKPITISFSPSIPLLLSRIETLQIVFDRAPSTFHLFDRALARLRATIHQLSTMLLSLDENQRQRMDVHDWLAEAGRLLQLVKGVVNESFEKNGRITRVWTRVLRAKIEGEYWERGRVVDLSMRVLELCVGLRGRYERLVWDCLRDGEELRGAEGERERERD